MARVKIVGAGSIGNHLSHACREQGYAVTLCDRDPEALRRAREEIYPDRYGGWDDGIRLAEADAVEGDSFDVVIPSLPGFGYSTPLTVDGVQTQWTADLWARLMTVLYRQSRQTDALRAYRELAEDETRRRNVHFVGRLARYCYLNMDEAMLAAFTTFDTLRQRAAEGL